MVLTTFTPGQIYGLILHKKMFFIYIFGVKDLIFITAYCPTDEQIDALEKCLESVKKTGCDILLVSHTHIPIHIQKKCQYYVYDYLNEISDDYNLFGDNFVQKSQISNSMSPRQFNLYLFPGGNLCMHPEYVHSQIPRNHKSLLQNTIPQREYIVMVNPIVKNAFHNANIAQ